MPRTFKPSGMICSPKARRHRLVPGSMTMCARLRCCLVPLLVAIAAATVSAEPYPGNNLIRIVIPATAGSPPDVLSRVVASELIEGEGWRVVVENKPGALQTIGVTEALKYPADGYTILAMSAPLTVAPALLPHLGLRLDADFVPVVKMAMSYNVLVVNSSVPANSLADLVTLLRANPDKYNFPSLGFGTPSHLIGELLKLRAGVGAAHVPYPGGQQWIGDLLTDKTQFSFTTTFRVLDLIATGKLRALAVTAPQRIASLKNVPTVAEEGFPELLFEDWVGLAMKRGTPAEIVERVNAAVNKALAKPRVREAFANTGSEAAGGSSSEFGALITSQLDYWRRFVTDANITLPR
jgi:tripartite-type tricarboxylate transporter receptor subunit TctC